MIFGLAVGVQTFAAALSGAMKNAIYPTDLTDAQWQLLEKLLPKPKRRGRPRTPLRQIVNALLYVVKSGCHWRLLPQTFPPWQTVYHIFRQWCRNPRLAALHSRLVAQVRQQQGKRCRPTAASLDSQTVRSAGHGGAVGYDAAKKTKGRKRFLLVDTLGLVLGVHVTPASTPERAGAVELLEPVLPYLKWLRKLWVDGGYSGSDFADRIKELRPKLEVELIKRSDDLQGFHILPKRWVVERTFAWLVHHHRLVRDYEKTETSATGWIFVAMIRIMLRKLA